MAGGCFCVKSALPHPPENQLGYKHFSLTPNAPQIEKETPFCSILNLGRIADKGGIRAYPKWLFGESTNGVFLLPKENPVRNIHRFYFPIILFLGTRIRASSQPSLS